MEKDLVKLIPIALATFLILVFSSCKKDSNSNCCTNIDVAVQIHYQTQSGENLLNSTDDFNESKIKIYYKNDNEFEYINRGNLDHPKMYRIDEDDEGNLTLTVFPSDYYAGNESTTLIELNENVVDTLVGEFELDGNNEICKRAWLNGVEMDNRFLEVKK